MTMSSSYLNRRSFLKKVAAGTAVAAAPRWLRAGDAPAGKKPNVLFILADDIGYGDLGCQGAVKVKTPNLDRLASQGVRFTDAHSPSSMCTPTRYAFITGRYAWRNPPTARGVLSGEAPLSVAPGTFTVAAAMKQAGYATGIVGKWHLGLGEGKTNYNVEIKPGPLDLGFDYAFIMPATGDRVPCVYVENRRVVGLDPSDPISLDYSVSRGDPESFVLGVPRIGKMTGGKAALWKDEEQASTYVKKAVAFIEQHKDEPFFLYLATHDIHVPRVPNARFKGTSQAGVRGDTIHSLDWTVGEVLATLDRLNLSDNTLVIFTSDNGGVLDANGPDKEHGGTVETNNGHLFNGPLRGQKGQLYEGGHRVPFIARWPGRIQPGRTADDLIAHVDMLATFAAVGGVQLPDDAAPDSFNELPALLGEIGGRPVRDHLVVHSGSGQLAIRQGPWKLIPAGQAVAPKKPKKATKAEKAGKRQGPGGQGELFNLADDLPETNNLIAAQPEIAAKMQAMLQTIRESGHSRPGAR